MELSIRLFATLKDRAGSGAISVNVSEPATVADVLTAVAGSYPVLAPALGSVIVAVNHAFAGETTAVVPGDEVAMFPPVSGGSADMPYPTYFSITTDDLDTHDIQARITQPDVGAVVCFTGHVRGETRRDGLPATTLYLEYEAYSAMAEQKMAQIAAEIWQHWPLVKGVAIVQRIGRLDVGDVTTFVACAGGHRDQGVFEAARYGIDRLKEIVPVWKREVGPDRSVWVEGHYVPGEEDN